MAVAICSLLDELRDERVDRRHLERDADAEAKRQNDDVPNLDVSGEDEEPEDQREGDLGHLRPDEDLAFIVTIGGLAAFHREQNGRDTRRCRGQPKVQPAIGERAHHPALRHHLHPGAGIRDGRADDVTPEGSLLQQRPRA